jgi:NAD(P)-dependent dehydrogenase (short-subunit alcohol dehydrogenase family)
MSEQFAGKTALRGGTGIGQAAALGLASDGCTVTVAGRTETTLKETVALIEAAGWPAQYVLCDVTVEADVEAAVLAAVGDESRLDFGINSAGIDGGDDSEMTTDYDTETFDEMMAVNVRG